VTHAEERVLLTGASGYVGGRLLPRLEKRGLLVRCLARRPEFLAGRVGTKTEVVEGDVLNEESLRAALEGVHTAYYLVHSMGSASREGFEAQDRSGAQNFGRAALAAGVRRIVYLGGLGDEDSDLSPHLRSRHEVGRALRSSGVPMIEFRASVVIGSGSLSFEMLGALVERLPVMVTPRWVNVSAQPIAIGDLIAYLEAALDLETEESRIYEIGGADRVSYCELMREYARQRQLRRIMIPVPLLTPRLSSLWLGLVTPLYARVGRALIESICHETAVRDHRARHDFAVEPMGAQEAIAKALANEDREFAQTRWSVVGRNLSRGHGPGTLRQLRRSAPGAPPDRLAGVRAGRASRRRLRTHSLHRRQNRLVRVRLALASAGIHRSARRRRRDAQGASRPRASARRRLRGLVACRDLRARPPPPHAS
jgi:uncharacterized protein YbjT (DUF2867 family)